MRRRLLRGVAAAVAMSALVAAPTPARSPGQPVSLRKVALGTGAYISQNLDYVATIPLDAPGVGARIVQVGKQRRLYVTGVPGLSIYDVTAPESPVLLGHLPLPHWENEDVTVAKDGSTVLMSEYTGTYMWVIDASNPLVPRLVGFLPDGAGHTVECVDDRCNWVYGSEGSIIDLRDKAAPKLLAKGWAQQLGLPRNGHNVERDAQGIVWTDTRPIAALDVREPSAPRLVAVGWDNQESLAYQHNNIRPRAAEYRRGRVTGPAPRAGLRPGELLMTSGEDNFSVRCGPGSGPFSTWSVAGFEQGGRNRFQLLDVLRPVSEDVARGDAAVNALGCSSHWFTVNPDGRTAAVGWYEHGTRVLDVDPGNGKITQRAFYQPVAGSASAAYWIGDRHIYVVDYVRGIDILRYEPDEGVPSRAEIDASWLAKLGAPSPVGEAERYRCAIGRFE